MKVQRKGPISQQETNYLLSCLRKPLPRDLEAMCKGKINLYGQAAKELSRRAKEDDILVDKLKRMTVEETSQPQKLAAWILLNTPENALA